MGMTEWRERYQISGWSGLITSWVYFLMNKVFYFDYLYLMTLVTGDTDPSFFQAIPNFQSGFMPESEILRFAQDSVYQLNSEFLNRALQNKDLCYGIWRDQDLASYGWYSSEPTQVTSEFKILFPANFIYMHHGYTNPAFRGQRLHAFGMAHALRYFTEHHGQGLISIVAGENRASLKSTERLGYRVVGKIYLFGCLNRYFVFHDRGARRTGACLIPLRENLKFMSNSHPPRDQLSRKNRR